MCRIVLAVGKVPTAQVIDGFLQMATSCNVTHEKNRTQTYKHPDGWGAVTQTAGKFELYKKPVSAWEDPYLQLLKETKPELLLLHARRASLGLPIDLEHTQPYQEDGWYFCHNGTINDLIGEEKTSDSLLFFQSILLQIKQGSKPPQAIAEALKAVQHYSAINTVLLNKKAAYILNRFNENPILYTMKYLQRKDLVIVSSERLPAIQGEWKELGNGRLLTVDSSDLRLSVATL